MSIGRDYMSVTRAATGRVHRAYAWGPSGQIHYRRGGPAGARSPLVLLHDRPGTGAVFEPLMDELGTDRSVLAPDLPGSGMSDPLEQGNDARASAQAILDIVPELGLGMVDVLGFRDGTGVAEEMARQQPDVVRKLILLAAPAGKISQPVLSLELDGFSEAAAPAIAGAIRDFLDR